MAGRRDIELGLRVTADLNQAKRSLDQLQQTLDRNGVTADRAGRRFNAASNSLDRMRRDAAQLPALLNRITTLLGLAFSTREIARATEAWTTMRNRLALVTESSEELAAAQDSVFRIAQESRQPLTATAELYQRIATNADELKLSAAGLEGVVSTVNKTLAISGTQSAAAEAALIQLGQAFASNELRGQELLSVLEQAPALAKAIADGLGVAVGDLKSLGEEGRLTAQSVVTALQKSAESVDQQFSRIQVTGGQALTVLGNSLTRVIGELDVATGSSQAFASALGELTEWLDSGALTEGVVETLEIWGNTFDLLSDDFYNLAEAAGVSFEDIEKNGDELNQFLIKAFRELPANIRAAIQLAATEILVLFDRITSSAKLLTAAVKSAFTDDTIDQAVNDFKARQTQITQLRKDSIASILEERDATLEVDAAEKQRRENERKAREEARTARAAEIAAIQEQARNQTIDLSGANSKKTEQKRLKQLEDDAKKVAELRVRLLQAQGKEEEAIQAEFEARYGDLLKRLEERSDETGQAIINNLLDLEKLRARFKTAQEEIDRVLQNQQQQETSINAQREAGLITEAEARRRIVELHRETYAELEKQRPLLEELAQQPGEVGRAAGEALAQLNAQAEQLRYTMDLLQSTLRNSIESGLTDAIEGLAKGTLTFKQAITELAQGVADAIIRITAEAAAQKITGFIFNRGEGGDGDMAKGAAATTAAAGALSVASVQWTATAAAIQAAAASLAAANATGGSGGGSGGSSGGGWAGTLFNAVASYYAADGGHITGPGTSTSDSIPAMLSDGEFVNRAAVVKQPGALGFLHDFNKRGMAALADWAPTYHNTGGLAGVPAPAMPSPTLGTRMADPSADQEAAGGRNLRIMNIVDPELVKDFMNSAEGDQVYINQVKRNTSVVKSLLGIGRG